MTLDNQYYKASHAKKDDQRQRAKQQKKGKKMSELKSLTRAAYDVQKLRIQTGLRVVANFKVKLGQQPGERESELDAEAKKILERLRMEHKLLTDGAKRFSAIKFEENGIIDNLTSLALVDFYFSLKAREDDTFKRLGTVVSQHPLWDVFLKDVKGLGPAMAGVILSEIDIHKARYPSSLWAYAGLDVAGNGKGRSRKKEHQIDIEYADADGVVQTRKGITFNPFLKTKLIGVLGGCILKANDPTYRKIYDDYKHRLENHETYKDVSKGHRHNMATRYMIKRFLVDLYKAWRAMEGLPVAPEYQEAKLGHTHNAA